MTILNPICPWGGTLNTGSYLSNNLGYYTALKEWVVHRHNHKQQL